MTPFSGGGGEGLGVCVCVYVFRGVRRQTLTHVQQIRRQRAPTVQGAAESVSAWLQTTAPRGLADPGARGGRTTAGRDEHRLALPVFSLLLLCPIRSPHGDPSHAPLSRLCSAGLSAFNMCL